jgi:hypothetical protein
MAGQFVMVLETADSPQGDTGGAASGLPEPATDESPVGKQDEQVTTASNNAPGATAGTAAGAQALG